MRKRKIALPNLAILIATIISLMACDKDLANIDSDITDDSIKNFHVSNARYPVTAYTQPIDAVQTSNLLGSNLASIIFGYYSDPLLGNTTYNFLSSLRASNYSPEFGFNIELDSVVLTIPYYSHPIGTGENGNALFKLDSVYNEDQPMNVSVYRSNYFLRDKNPDSVNEDQRFYSNQTDGSNIIGEDQLEQDLLFFQENFIPSDQRIKLIDEFDGRDSTFVNPSLRLVLDKTNIDHAEKLNYWKEAIIDKEDDSELSSQQNFRNYFRGVYLKASPKNDQGSTVLFDLASGGSITLYYTSLPTQDATDRRQGNYSLSFSGRQAIFIKNDFNIDQGNVEEGDASVILKGGAGSIAAVSLFGGEMFDDDMQDNEFEAFKKYFVNTDEDGNFLSSRKLLNEANLVFYVDQPAVSIMSPELEPEQLILYNLKNGTILKDFSRNPAGFLKREGDVSDGKGVKYKLKLTEHLNDIILRDSTNVKLGLAVLGNITTEISTPQLDVVLPANENLSIPTSTLYTPKSTVLYGNKVDDESKKLYLELFYTDIENQE